MWIVFDDDTGMAYGPFPTRDAAQEYANALYPEDGDGFAEAYLLTPP